MPNPYALDQLRRLASRFTMNDPDELANPDLGGSIDTDIALPAPPAPPRMPGPANRPNLVSRGGDMAPSLDEGVPAFSGASVLMSAPPGERVTYDDAQAPSVPSPTRTNLYTGGGNLQGNSAMRDPYVQRYLGQQDLAGDLEDQIINQTKARGYALASSNPAVQREANAYGGNIDAFQRLLNNTNQDIQESPITAGIAQDRGYREAEQAAFNQGFTGGNAQQAAGRYGREAEMAKINATIKQAEAEAQGKIRAQEIAEQGARDVANINAQSLAQQYASLQAALSGGNPEAVKAVTLPKGGGSVSYQSLTQQRTPPIPAALMRDITTARTKLQTAGPTKNFLGMFPYGQTPEKIMYDQAIANGISAYEQTHPGSRDVADLASYVAGEPDLAGLTADEVMQHPKIMQHFDLSGMTPEEREQLDQLLYVVRGMPGAAGQTDPDSYFISGAGIQ